MCLAAFAGLLAELGGDLFVGLGGFEPLNIIKSQVEFGVQPVGLRRFWGQCCKNAVGLPVGLAPPPSPTVFLLIFMSLPRGPRWGACGSLCSLVAVRIVLIFQLDPLPLRSPTTYFSCFFQLRSSILSAIHAFLFHQKKKLFFPTGDPLMLGIADAIGGAQMPYSMAIALKQISQINAGGSSA